MILDYSTSVTHKPCNVNSKKHSEEEVQKVIIDLMQKNGFSSDCYQINNDGVLELKEIAPIKLHTLMLQAEQEGLEVKYTKKTLIEVH